jgi:hypothetical protein
MAFSFFCGAWSNSYGAVSASRSASSNRPNTSSFATNSTPPDTEPNRWSSK